jgi:hypothetical protein
MRVGLDIQALILLAVVVVEVRTVLDWRGLFLLGEMGERETQMQYRVPPSIMVGAVVDLREVVQRKERVVLEGAETLHIMARLQMARLTPEEAAAAHILEQQVREDRVLL